MTMSATKAAKLIAGNWKMNGDRAQALAYAAALADAAKGAEWPKAATVLVCPPAPLVPVLAQALAQALVGTPVRVGGQDCHAKVKGAHTGDTSAALLADLGATACIVGHSERRTDHGETDAQVKAKAEAAIAAGLLAIVCVGETEAQRKAGEALAVVERLPRLPYRPVAWNGKSAPPSRLGPVPPPAPSPMSRSGPSGPAQPRRRRRLPRFTPMPGAC